MMIPENALIVVADGEGATLFRNKGRGGAVSLESERRMTPKNLEGDGPAGHRPEESSPKETDEATFAKQLALALNKMVVTNKADAVVIVADPSTLGQMRKSYHGELEKRIVKEIAKDMTNMTSAEIEKALAA